MGKADAKRRDGGESLPLRLVSADTSFEGLPFFLVSTGRVGEQLELRFARHHEYWVDGEKRSIDQRWEVRASGSLGLPGRADQDVYMAVHELIKDRGGIPENGELYFSLYELMAYLGWTGSGNHYEDIRRSLRRVGSTMIDCDRAFWSNRRRRFVTDTFNIWTFHSTHYDEGPKGPAADRQLLRLHPLFVENYEENYLNQLDSGFYWSLKSHTAKRLYRLLESYAIGDEKGPGVWETALLELRDLVPLAGSYKYGTKVKEKLSKAHAELLERGYLQDLRYIRSGPKREVVRYEISPDFPRRRMESAIEGAVENQAALNAMKEAGVPRKVRLQVLREHHPDTCLKFASLLPYQKNLSKPVAAFRWALNNPSEARWWNDVPVRDSPGGQYSGREEPDTSGNSEDVLQGRDKVGDSKLRQVTPDFDPEALPVWEKVLEDVSEEINAPSLRVWFEGTIPVSLTADTLTISAPNSVAKDYIESRFLELLEGALSDHLSPTSSAPSLEIVVEPSEPTHNTDERLTS